MLRSLELFIYTFVSFNVLMVTSDDGHYLESPKLSSWGEWGQLEHCPGDQVVVGMKLKVHDNQGVKDDTGLNAVKFYCQNPFSPPQYSDDIGSITSLVGDSGEWKKDFFCPQRSNRQLVAVGFQLRSETSSGVKDDTAGNNLKLICSDLYQRLGYEVLEGDGTTRGIWTKQQLCWSGYAICGLQTQVETSRSMDTTGLNNLKVRCCQVGGTGNPKSDSMESSSADSSSENSPDSSEEKHHAHRGDHHDHGKDSHEDLSAEKDTSQEQELITIDPEPTSAVDVIPHKSHIPTNSSVDLFHHTEDNLLSRNADISNEDENLPEEIANIEPVDNSEAHKDEVQEEMAATTSHSHHIPQEVVNALEDADADTVNSRNQDDSFLHALGDEENNTNHLDSITHLNEISDQDLAGKSAEEHGDNPIDQYVPKPSPRFGQTEIINTASVVSKASNPLSNIGALGVGSMIVLYLAKLI